MTELAVTLVVLVLLMIGFVICCYALYQLTLSEEEAGEELMDYIKRRLYHRQGE